MKILQICPPHLSDIATLPWEIQKSHFQHIHTYFCHTWDTVYIETKYNIEISTDIKLLYTSARFTNVHAAKFLSVSAWNDTIRYDTLRYEMLF